MIYVPIGKGDPGHYGLNLICDKMWKMLVRCSLKAVPTLPMLRSLIAQHLRLTM